jgi:hypothetical protein
MSSMSSYFTLLDAQIWTFHSGLAVSFVSVSRFGGRRNSDRRSFGDRFGYIIWISILGAAPLRCFYRMLICFGLVFCQ